jgi:nucleotide-binding universal stress UspA family protein
MNSENKANRAVIIAAIDRTAESDPAALNAAALAHATAGAELHLVHVVPPLPEAAIPAVTPSALLDHGRTFIEGVAKTLAARFDGRIVAHVAVGDPAREILQLATDLDADIIVVGTHRKNAIERMLVGSVSLSVVKKAACAVVVARPKEYSHSDVPEIEPPCPACLDTQRRSKGEKLWCEEHSKRHPHGRLHYEMPNGYGAGSMFIRADRP